MMTPRPFGVACAALSLLFACTSVPAQKQKEREATKISLSFQVDGESFSATVRGGDVAIELDGEPLAEDRYEKTDSGYQIRDRFGAIIAEIRATADGASVVCHTRNRRAYLGVDLQPLGPALAGHLGLDADAASHLVGVHPGSPAEAAGLEPHDIITHFDGKAPVTPERFREYLEACEPGDDVELRILRRGEEETVDVRLGRAPRADPRFTTFTLPEGETMLPGFTNWDVTYGGRLPWVSSPNVRYYWGTGKTQGAFVTPDPYRFSGPGGSGGGEDKPAGADEQGGEIDRDLREQIDRLEKRIDELQTLIRSLRERRDN
jgi:hypothetical protein